jgi:hypothetical protein
MDSAKLTASLLSQARNAGPGELLDVVVELSPSSAEPGVSKASSRAEEIAERKEAFNRDAVEAERVVREVGGEVTGRAWINRTLRCRVPVAGLERLSQLASVAVLDVPETIRPEGS